MEPPTPAVHSRCLGLIVGLGVGASVHYYRQLVKAHAARGSELRLLMAHADMSRMLAYVRSGERVRMAQYLAELIRQLHAGGAQIAAVSAVTPHMCAGELITMSPLPLVNVLEALDREVRARRLRRVALFGTRFTMESGLFGKLRTVELIVPRPVELEYIAVTYSRLAREGTGSTQDREELSALAHTLCDRDGAEAIVLAGTDLSVLFDENNTLFPHIDCSTLHINAIIRSLFLAPGNSAALP